MARSSCYMVLDEIEIVSLAWWLVDLTSIILTLVSWMFIHRVLSYAPLVWSILCISKSVCTLKPGIPLGHLHILYYHIQSRASWPRPCMRRLENRISCWSYHTDLEQRTDYTETAYPSLLVLQCTLIVWDIFLASCELWPHSRRSGWPESWGWLRLWLKQWSQSHSVSETAYWGLIVLHTGCQCILYYTDRIA